MKKQLLLLTMILLPLVASAETVEINGIYYNLITKAKQAEVTSNPNKYTGSVVIPETIIYEGEKYDVISISDRTFYYCINLNSVSIPIGVKKIGVSAFAHCECLNNLVIPNSVTCIDNGAFGNSAIKEITIPNNVTSLGDGAFGNCTLLTSVVIGNGVQIIGSSTFYNCINLTNVTIGGGITSIGSLAFNGCTKLTSLTIPGNVTSIGSYAFSGCTKLASITIPGNVSSIGISAFYNCSRLSTIVVGEGIKKIDEKAFSSCLNIVDFYCYAENVPNTYIDAFKDSYIEYATLHVPASAVNAYKAADPWKNFKSIISITDEDPKPTSIAEVKSKMADVRGAYYDLNGRKLSEKPSHKGIYINNGKKLVVK